MKAGDGAGLHMASPAGGGGCKCPGDRAKAGDETGARQMASWTGTGRADPGGGGLAAAPQTHGPGLGVLRVFKETEQLIRTCSLDF